MWSYAWLKTIGEVSVTHLEYLSQMGTCLACTNMMVVASSTINTGTLYLFYLSKADGTIVRTNKIDSTGLDSALTLSSSIMSDKGYDLIASKDSNHVYLAFGTTTNAKMGFLKLQDSVGSDVVDWYKSFDRPNTW